MSDTRHGPLIPGDVRQHWDDILPGLLAVKAKVDVSWRPEDVYAMCLIGKAHLYLCKCGFVILQEEVDEHTLRRELLVWIAYGVDHAQNEHTNELIEMARRVGASRLKVMSPRRGFEKAGWKIDAITYYKEV
jgi:hypothetical protein